MSSLRIALCQVNQHVGDLDGNLARSIDVAEWKRRQTPVGVRVTAKAFGKDRRMPITNGYRW